MQQYRFKKPLDRLKEYNFDIKKSFLEVSVAKHNLESTRNLFLPNVEVSENYTNTNDPLNVFGFRLKQGITTEGDFNPDLLNNPENLTNFNTRIDISQPLINANGFVQRSALKEYYQSVQHSLTHTIQFVTLLIKQHYAELWLSYKSIEAVKISLKAAEKAHKLAKDNFQVGYVLKSDVLEAELYVLNLEIQLEEIRNRYEHASDRLKHLIQLNNLKEHLIPTEDLTIPELQESENYDLDQRSDFKALSHRVLAVQKNIQAQKFKYISFAQ